MGNFVPVALAFGLNANGVYVFREAGNLGCDTPAFPAALFLFSVFLLLWEVSLYPCSLRRLWNWGAQAMDFFLSLFVMEHLVSDFWGPLEVAAQTFIPRVADAFIEVLNSMGFGCSFIVDILDGLRCDGSSAFAGYLLSIFFFCVVIHATRIVDFRLLSCGFGVFIRDPIKRFHKMKRRLMCMMGMKCRSVEFSCRPKCPRPRCPPRCPKPCYDDEDFDDSSEE